MITALMHCILKSRLFDLCLNLVHRGPQLRWSPIPLPEREDGSP